MSFDPSSIESDLGRLRASSLDESFLARLEACADDSWTAVAHTEAVYEQELKSHAPAPLPPALMQSLLTAVSTTQFPDQQNIVRFPHSRESASPAPRRQRSWWGAAAAVAIAGALSALMVPQGQKGQPNTASVHQAGSPASAASGSRFIPAGFARGLADASDEGVIWQKDNRPQRVLRVVYKDRVTLKDQNGKTYQVEQPRVEYIIVPATTN